jgi:hypothetical protein
MCSVVDILLSNFWAVFWTTTIMVGGLRKKEKTIDYQVDIHYSVMF